MHDDTWVGYNDAVSLHHRSLHKHRIIYESKQCCRVHNHCLVLNLVPIVLVLLLQVYWESSWTRECWRGRENSSETWQCLHAAGVQALTLDIVQPWMWMTTMRWVTHCPICKCKTMLGAGLDTKWWTEVCWHSLFLESLSSCYMSARNIKIHFMLYITSGLLLILNWNQVIWYQPKPKIWINHTVFKISDLNSPIKTVYSAPAILTYMNR